MSTYSMDLRDRVVAACDCGVWSREEIAEEYDVSTSWIRRLLQRRRDTGDYGPRKTKPGRKPVFSGVALTRLEELVRQQPDATLAELRERSGADCSLVTMHNTLKQLGYRRKKRPCGRLSKTVLT